MKIQMRKCVQRCYINCKVRLSSSSPLSQVETTLTSTLWQFYTTNFLWLLSYQAACSPVTKTRAFIRPIKKYCQLQKRSQYIVQISEFDLILSFTSGPAHMPFPLSEHSLPPHFTLLDLTHQQFPCLRLSIIIMIRILILAKFIDQVQDTL